LPKITKDLFKRILLKNWLSGFRGEDFLEIEKPES
jgi:hypothetical protein